MLSKISKWDKYIAIFSVLALFLILGGSYALVSWQTNDYNIALDSSCLTVNYLKGQDFNDTVGTIDESTYYNGKSITMNSNMAFTTVSIELDDDCFDMYGLATIELNITSLSNVFKSGGDAYNKLVYVVAEYNASTYNNPIMSSLEGHSFDVVGKGYITNTGVIDAYSKYMEPGEKKDYLVIFYSTLNDQLLSASFGASIDTRVVQSNPTPIDNFEYSIGTLTIEDSDPITIPTGKVLLTKYNGGSNVVNVPSSYTINGTSYDTIILSNGCFVDNTNITTVRFGDGVSLYSIAVDSLISNSANRLFYGCNRLTNIPSIPSTVTDISSAFYGCTALVRAPIISDSVTNMGSAFIGCTHLSDVPYIGNSVTYMHTAFYGCTSLVDVPAIPNTVTNMDSTFYGCTSLVNAPALGSSVQNMNSTFYGCTSLVNGPTIPSTVTYMTQTFYRCTNLTGTIRINSSNVTRTTGGNYHPFYNTSSNKPITVEVPTGSTTYTTINTNKPSNVTIVEY